MSEPTCTVCGAAEPAAFICMRCTRQLERAIAELPAAIGQLHVTVMRQSRVGNLARTPGAVTDEQPGEPALLAGPYHRVCQHVSCELLRLQRRNVRPARTDLPVMLRTRDQRIALPATQLVYNPDAAHLHALAVNAVQTWARHIAETRGIDLYARTRTDATVYVTRNRWHLDLRDTDATTTTDLCTWLVAHIGSVRQDEAAAEMHTRLRELLRRIEAVIDRHEPEVFAGRCTALTVRLADVEGIISPDVGQCGAELLANLGDTKVQCRECGAFYDVTEQRHRMRDGAPDKLLRPAQIASALTSLDEPVGIDKLYKWLERDRAVMAQIRAGERRPPAYPLILEAALDAGGHALYRLGDVQARLAWVRERGEARRMSA